MNPDDPVESAIIAALGAHPRPSPDVVLGIGDDCAILSGGRVWTVDTMVEGVHWDHRLSPADVGYKLVAVNVSDVAAMGGLPRLALLSVSVPPGDLAWVEGFAQGLREALGIYEISLVGGDTTRSPVRTVSLSLEGIAPRPVRRDGARAGDTLWVVGTLGLAAEAMLADTPRPEALAWLRRPQPCPRFAAMVAPHLHAMMDVSDGLRTDLRRMMTASGTGAAVRSVDVPGTGPLPWRVAYGDDYALLLAAPPAARDALCSAAEMHALPIAAIGEVTTGSDICLDGAAEWPAAAFSHFSRGGR